MSNLKIEIWPIDRIRPFPENVRIHSEKQLHFITQSIRQFGFVNPVLVDADGECIAGHGRLQAMRLLERSEVPVIVLGHLTPQQANAYRIADNQIPLSAEWDEEKYRAQLQDFMDAGFPMDAVGWGTDDLNEFMAVGNLGLTDPDETPEPVERPVVQYGEKWILGDHRILCGDCTSADDVDSLFVGKSSNLMVTDPPYGVEYDAQWRNESFRPYNRATGVINNDERADWREAYSLFDGDVAYVWHGGLKAGTCALSLEAAGFQVRSQIIWAKPVQVVGRGNYHWQHEPCWYAVRKKAHWHGNRKQTTLWQIKNMHVTQGSVDDGKTAHSAQKPVECMKRPIENNSAPGDIVYDPFVGSGTTIIAAEMTGRHCFAIEINPVYVQMAIERWQKFTGHEATLNGKTFAAIVENPMCRWDGESDVGV